MVATRRSRSLNAQTDEAAAEGQDGQLEASTEKDSSDCQADAGHDAAKQLQPIAEEPAVAAAAAASASAAAADHVAVGQQQEVQQTLEGQQNITEERQQGRQQARQQPAPLPAARRGGGQRAAAAAAASDDISETELEADSDDAGGWDFDGPDMLQNLAASIRSALGSSEPAGQQQQQQQHAAAAAGHDSDAEDMELGRLRWRPQTGLQLPARAARVVAAAAAASQQQHQLAASGPQVHNPAAAAAAEEQDLPGTAAPAPEGPSVAAATKPKGLAQQLPAAATAAKQRRKKASSKGAATAAPAAGGPAGAKDKWYQLPAVAITDEVKRDLRLLRLRGAYDPKRFYKSFDETKFPKHFAIGTVVDDALDFYGGRLSAGQRKATLTEQLLADQELQHTRKKRYSKLQEEAQRWVKHKKRKTSQPRKTPSKHRPKH